MRIASLSPAATEILFAFGLGKDIVCTDQFSNFPDEAKAIPHLKDHQKINEDALREFQPEIVLTGTVIQEKLAEILRAEGFGVVHQDPRMLGQIYESIRQLGTIFSVERAAEALILQMQQGLNAVKKKAALLPRRLKVYVEEWHLPPMASGNWVPEIVRMAGGEPFPPSTRLRRTHEGYLSWEVTLEEVKKFNPDLMVISWCGAGALADKNIVLQRPDWQELSFVQKKQVRVIDDSLLNRPGPRVVEGAQRLYGWMFELLH